MTMTLLYILTVLWLQIHHFDIYSLNAFNQALCDLSHMPEC